MNRALNKGHTKGPNTRAFCRYTIYDNRTDFPVVVDATARECAEIMGKTLNTFYCLVNRVMKGKNNRWSVLRRFLDVEDDLDGDQLL